MFTWTISRTWRSSTRYTFSILAPCCQRELPFSKSLQPSVNLIKRIISQVWSKCHSSLYERASNDEVPLGEDECRIGNQSRIRVQKALMVVRRKDASSRYSTRDSSPAIYNQMS